MDRISDLPIIILHDILSKLSHEDCVRTSVLSKAWRETWNTFPIFSIWDTDIIGTILHEREVFLSKRDIFIEHVNKTLLRKRDLFRDQGLALKEFSLSMNFFDLEYMSHDTDLWMKLAIESGVEVLELVLHVLEAKSLKKLLLYGGVRVLNHSIRFCSLQVLSLSSVLLGDVGVVQQLISHSPMIEQITLIRCYAVYNSQWTGRRQLFRTSLLKSLSMKGLEKLKAVQVLGIPELSIDAPNLEKLCYSHTLKQEPFRLDFSSCRNLRYLRLLTLKAVAIDDKWFLDLFSRFPFLERLKLGGFSMPNRINISSDQLKDLNLSSCFNTKEINIDAPKLLICRYCSKGDSVNKPVISFHRSSNRLKFIFVIDIDYAKLYNLREIMPTLKPQNVYMALSLIIQSFEIESSLNVLQVLSPLPNIKELDLRAVPKNEAMYLPFVNGLLSTCCPEIITLSLDPYFCCESFIKLLYETLTGKRQDECYCSSGDTKCWWHDLKNVKVSSSTETYENNGDYEILYIKFMLEI